ncbi:hypothetical protein MTO96_000903 [Rhipicephalus appendiculatus]
MDRPDFPHQLRHHLRVLPVSLHPEDRFKRRHFFEKKRDLLTLVFRIPGGRSRGGIGKLLALDKYQISTEGDLVIDRVDMADARRKYRCITRNILVGETVSGSSWAQLLVTDTSNYLPPRIRRLKQTVKLSAGDPLRLACVAQGYPAPSYRWYRKKDSLTIPLGSSGGSGGRIRVYRGFLLVQSTMRQDAGTFVCVANNTAGEDRALFEVIVTSAYYGRQQSRNP